MKLLKPYVIRTEINTFVPFATQRAGGVLFKILKYFEVMLNIFELSSGYNFSPGDWSMQINSYGLPNRISWPRLSNNFGSENIKWGESKS